MSRLTSDCNQRGGRRDYAMACPYLRGDRGSEDVFTTSARISGDLIRHLGEVVEKYSPKMG